MPLLATPDQVEHWHLKLGTHPDLIDRLWVELQATLPADCRRIFYGTPVLMHPTTGIVFAFAGGTNTKDEKAQYVAECFAAFEQLLGNLHEESYLHVQDVRAEAYGYGGQTQEFRYIKAKSN